MDFHCIVVQVNAPNPEGCERLFRYCARGPIAAKRLHQIGDDTYRYDMKRRVYGKTSLVMSGAELLRKLSILIPPQKLHLVHYHGAFAPNSKVRSKIVPQVQEQATTPTVPEQQPSEPNTWHIDWASLLKRV